MDPFDGLIKTFENDATTTGEHWTRGFEVFSRITPRAEFSRKRCVDMASKKSSYKDWRSISIWKGCLSILLMLFSLKSLKSKINWDQRAWNIFQFLRAITWLSYGNAKKTYIPNKKKLSLKVVASITWIRFSPNFLKKENIYIYINLIKKFRHIQASFVQKVDSNVIYWIDLYP